MEENVSTSRIKSFLEVNGFSCSIERRPAYRGSIEPIRDIITAERGGIRGFPRIAEKGRFYALRKALRAVPLAAQILDVFDLGPDSELALFEAINGVLVWELEGSNRPTLAAVESAIGAFVSSLQHVNLVNADIRPWNIIHQRPDDLFRFIDWGFSFFVGGPKSDSILTHLRECGHGNRPELEIDEVDMKRTISTLRSPVDFEELHGYSACRLGWRPEPWLE